MNQINRLIVAVVFSALVAIVAFWPGGQEGVIAARPEMVTICHIPEGIGYLRQITIIIDEAELPAHLAHGDFLGPCP